MAKTMRDDDHRQGMVSNTALTLLLTFIVLGVLWGVFTILQITSTEQAVLGLLQAGVAIQPGMTVNQAVQFMQGSLDKNQQIANAIGWGVQAFLYMIAFPPDSTFLRMHRKTKQAGSTPESLMRTARRLSRLKTFLTIVLVAGDVVTDFLYVVSGHAIFPVGGGILLAGLLFPAAVCGVTIFCGRAAIHSLEALVDTLRGR